MAGHNGMVGSAIVRQLKSNGFKNIIVKNSSTLDLRNQHLVQTFFEEEKPDVVFLAAAKVGGIQANNVYKAEFLYDNLMIESNIIHSAYTNKVEKLLFLGSSCIYPKLAKQPIHESELLTGTLESTNEPYAIAKIAGVKLCDAYRFQYGCDFISAMPTNLYGPNDNYDLENSHVLPALIRKIYTAKVQGKDQVEIWGSGKPLREFLHVDDLAKACLFLMENYGEPGPINVGSEVEISIAELANVIAEAVGYQGNFVFNTEKPDGTPRKLMDSSRIKNLGWRAEISLRDGIKATIKQLQEDGTLQSFVH